MKQAIGGQSQFETRLLDPNGIDSLFDALRRDDFRIVGPKVRDGAIGYEPLGSAGELPIGWADEQEAGRYRLVQRSDGAYFGFAVGPDTWKRFLFPPRVRLWKAKQTKTGFRIVEEAEDPPKQALIGVRACELRAIEIQDGVFLGQETVEPVYAGRRDRLFIVALNCGHATGTCFCASMGTGPKVAFGADLVLTELISENRHQFLIEAVSERGGAILDRIPTQRASDADLREADRVIDRTVRRMGRGFKTDNLKTLLYRNQEHPRWDEVAERCLACGNCTMVCPTCFCSNLEDRVDLSGAASERWRTWDSCFTGDFSFVHGGSIRSSRKARYRHWLTHKLATWQDQFGSSGCVGCGRCITWCPPGIDLREEVRAIRGSDE